MAHARHAYMEKIVNPQLANSVMNTVEPHGEFKAFVRLAKPEKRPTYMKSMELHSPGLFKARIRCDQMKHVADDNNVISIELREHIA